MAIPDFQSFLKPLLDIAADGIDHSLRDARTVIADKMAISEVDLQDMLPSGNQTRFENRTAWAKSFLGQAKVLESPRRGWFRITERGRDLLKQKHDRIDIRVLNQYPEFVEFRTSKAEKAPDDPADTQDESQSPEESLQIAYEHIRSDLAGQILEKIKINTPQFFEQLVVDLMVAMGYGGSRSDAGKSIGSSGDEGVDGIIKEDKLGLDLIYLQAKRWQGTVGRPEVQKFVGALHGKKAQKGVFITTGKYSDDASKYADTMSPKVILIDGKTLANLMIDHDLGTSTTGTYKLRRIDSDYFAEE